MPTVQLRHPVSADVITVDESLEDYYRRQGWQREPTAAELAAAAAELETQELKGAALDEALEEAGLSKSGTADEKRARLADHLADTSTPTPPEEQ